MKIKGVIVPPSICKDRTVLTIEPPEVKFFIGHGNSTIVCGKCGSVLAENIFVKDLVNKLFKCNNCESVNEVEEDDIYD